jgi:autotransporter strand-loop-strand O-heptosyltransferase
VKVVPEGVDTATYKPLKERPRTDKFRFVVVGRWEHRKATTEIIRAWIQAFEDVEDVELHLQVENPFALDALTTCQRLEAQGLLHPGIVVHDFMSQAKYVDMLQTSQVFVSCSRSEGWNLPLIEAMACGTPVICSNYGGQLEFVGQFAQLVDIIDHRPPQEVVMPGDDEVLGTWAEPDFDDLQQMMREMYENYEPFAELAARGAEYVRREFTWDKAAQRAVGVLEELDGHKPIWLNLGSGIRRLDGYVNVDLYDSTADVMADIRALPYKDGTVDKVHSSHVLEHFSHNETFPLLRHWYDVLKDDGQFEIHVPNLEYVVDYWLKSPEANRWHRNLHRIFGNQVNDGQYHKTGFTEPRLRQLLSDVGFSNIETSFEGEDGRESICANATKGRDYGREVIVMGGFPDTPEKETVLRECFARLKGAGLPMALVTHCPVSADLAGLFDYYIYEKENILSTGWDLNWWHQTSGLVRLEGKYGSGSYQPVAILSSWHNALRCLQPKFDTMHYVESDTMIRVLDYLKHARQQLIDGYKMVTLEYGSFVGNSPAFVTNLLSLDINWAIENVPKLKSWPEYLELNEQFRQEGITTGDCIFEIWMAAYLHHIGQADSYKVLGREVVDEVIVSANLIKREIKKNFRVDLSETDDGKVVVFLLNINEDTGETFECKVVNSKKVVHEFNAHVNVLSWVVVPKVDSLYEIYLDGELFDTIELREDQTYTDMKFKFDDDRLRCLEPLPSQVEQQQRELSVGCHFVEGPFVNLNGESQREYRVEFIDTDTDETVHVQELTIGHFTRPYRRWFTNWKVRVLDGNEVRYEHVLDLRDKRVMIHVGSKSLGDTLAWVPYVEAFRVRHGCQVTASSWWQELYASAYPHIDWVKPGKGVGDLYASYEVGCFDSDSSRNKHDWRLTPLQKVATDALGLSYVEQRPKIGMEIGEADIHEPYVCVSEHSTMQAKYWNYPGGWQKLVDMIREAGLEVVVVSKEPTSLMNVRRRVGKPIRQTVKTLAHARAFVGVGSGLSWLAWALNTPVVLVSGFSEPWCEFQSGLRRVHNPEVCHGCFNDPEFPFSRGDWEWCPRGKDFECTRTIKPEDVMGELRELLS